MRRRLCGANDARKQSGQHRSSAATSASRQRMAPWRARFPPPSIARLPTSSRRAENLRCRCPHCTGANRNTSRDPDQHRHPRICKPAPRTLDGLARLPALLNARLGRAELTLQEAQIPLLLPSPARLTVSMRCRGDGTLPDRETRRGGGRFAKVRGFAHESRLSG